MGGTRAGSERPQLAGERTAWEEPVDPPGQAGTDRRSTSSCRFQSSSCCRLTPPRLTVQDVGVCLRGCGWLRKRLSRAPGQDRNSDKGRKRWFPPGPSDEPPDDDPSGVSVGASAPSGGGGGASSLGRGPRVQAEEELDGVLDPALDPPDSSTATMGYTSLLPTGVRGSESIEVVDLGEKAVVPSGSTSNPTKKFTQNTEPRRTSDPPAANTDKSQPVSRTARPSKARTPVRPRTPDTRTPPPAWDDHTAWRAACLRAPSIEARRALIRAWAEAAGGSIDWDSDRRGLQLPSGLPEGAALAELRQHFLDEIELI